MFIRPEFLPEGSLIACDACGLVAVTALAPAWRSFRSFDPPGLNVIRHHCPTHVEINENIRSGLVYRASKQSAVTYEEGIWPSDGRAAASR